MKKRKDTAADSFSLINTTRKKAPLVPFAAIAEAALPKKYFLSVVLIDDKKALALNQEHRSKDTSANVLSFSLSKNAGEIFLNLDRAKREAPEFGRTYQKHLGNLFIHGIFHLKGHTHGSTMEKAERQIAQHFSLL